ncbi:hypothetical protein [Jannaschia donghaensis]|uniref:DUF2867 domain-containing protein n=1 Tax=Jannaschia donghaensis TaxID=420998 RepID=A0A0M6YLW3_9RHOB|nr:hypothetical protein [Jannaschia donghaensis]CTQ51351.1 hypothetical protein JDO7802_03390 [Jannaschia donghaensis]
MVDSDTVHGRLRKTDLPDWSLIARAADVPGTYTDCYTLDIARTVRLEAFIAAFYATRLFRAERGVLRLALWRKITDEDVARLADNQSDRFAAWSVSGRSANQIWLTDLGGYTMSWLAVVSLERGTRLHFGSVVVARNGHLPIAARALLPLHQIYAQALLRAAGRSLLSA